MLLSRQPNRHAEYLIINEKIKTMNKEEVIKRLGELNFPKDEYYVLSGASLVLRGIREKCSDIDLCISEELFDKVRDRLGMTPDKINTCNFYHLSDSLEIVVDKKSRFNMNKGNDFNLEDLKTILAFKESRNLPKDQQDIINIKNYLRK